jgi:hypothetical protein
VRKLDPCDVQDARVAQFAGETELTHPTGLRRSDINDINHALRRMLWNRGDYVRPIELVNQHLNART